MRIIRHCRMERDGMGDLVAIYFSISCIICFFLIIAALADDVCDEDAFLTDKTEFIRFVFIFQAYAYESLKDEINKAGIVIVESLIILFLFPWNVIIFIVLVIIKLISLFFYGFWLIFRIRKDDNNA